MAGDLMHANGNNLYCRLSRVLAALGALLFASVASGYLKGVGVAAGGLAVALAAFLGHYCEVKDAPSPSG